MLEKLVGRLKLILRQGARFETRAPSLTKIHNHLENFIRNSVGKDDFSNAQRKVHTIDCLVGARILVNISQRPRLAERDGGAPSLDLAAARFANRHWDEAWLVFAKLLVLYSEQLPQPGHHVAE